MKILLVEDEPKVAAFLQKGLTEQQHSVEVAADGPTGLRRALAEPFDLLILDNLLPGLNGLDVCRQVRTQNSAVPILMLTALGETDDKIRGLDAGADDYLVKPFAFQELLARIRALVRRRHESPSPEIILRLADLTLDPARKLVQRANQTIQLTAREFALLEYLLRNQERVVSRVDILEQVWETSFDTGSNVIDVYINFLRKKIDKDFSPKLIHTLVGMGYVMKEA
ncbi:two component transcriptional regulator, winged helix family [Hymenobacter roseosalivarius DSM 11622]|uniref:Two component transcriptional regulator, winged helix family n=1 Tax=Hymenobacter roseosalivarius DSM 11622 TaxID=645990 RepID=A0A1W1VHS2_9BACT|nr:response regulator transcription factor [Hymenobacter roseosalivarius]SMB92823.1 two component transcriptional regulator, winged helix family [Hymenobacter roseosalivarius DSM 11622]